MAKQKARRIHGFVVGALVIFSLTFLVFWASWPLWGPGLVRDLLTPSSLESQLPSDPELVGPPPIHIGQEKLDDRLAQLGQAGDAFGGFNALVGATTVLLLFATGYLQWRSMTEARDSILRQQFEDHFFRLLQLSREAAGEFHGTFKRKNGVSHELRGLDALNAYASRLAIRYKAMPINSTVLEMASTTSNPEAAKMLWQLVIGYLVTCYEQQPSAFGPYMRLLYRLFLYITEAELTDEEKEHYVKLAAATLTEGSRLLIAANGLTEHGRKKARKLIDQLGLLEHLHLDYDSRFSPALRLGYSSHAFKFSEISHSQPLDPELANLDFESLLKHVEQPSAQPSEAGSARF